MKSFATTDRSKKSVMNQSKTNAMRQVLKPLIILSSLFHPTQAATQAAFTEINGTVLYSEYHPNPKSKFKGTIVFQNGAGASLKTWTDNKTFFKCAKENGSMLIYDRSGLGQSPPDPSISPQKPITAQNVNSKLIQLLKRNHIRPPYILVSHSYGALYAGYFARNHPGLIAGMLMIDPVPSDYQYSNQILEKFKFTQAKLKSISSSEAYHSYNLINSKERNMMTADSYYQQLGFNKTVEQVAQSPRMSSTFPVIIISSSDMKKNAPIKGDWYALQQQWLNQNPNSVISPVQSGHFIQLERPEIICEQLKKLVEIAIQSSKSRQ